MTIDDADRAELQTAKNLLENPGLAARLTSFLGAPIEIGLKKLPKEWQASVGEVTQSALLKAAEAAIFTMKDLPGEAPSNLWHKLGVFATGATGGFFGLAAVAVELPVSTTVMLRSIADIARAHGERLSDIKTKLACLEVFALGGVTSEDDAAEIGYYAVRAALGRQVAVAADYLVANASGQELPPLLIKFITAIAERFGVQVSEKLMVQAVPVVGALAGALVNTVFIDHFQDMARGHFIVRKLERRYGVAPIQALYAALPKLG